jgi:Protein of unknown function (DUF2934)
LLVFSCNAAASRRLDPGPISRRGDARDFNHGLLGITASEGLLMAAKKKIARRKDTKVKAKISKKARKKKSAIAKPLRAKAKKVKAKPKPTVVAFVAAVPTPIATQPIVISYELVALRAFQIWQRKINTNYPEQNWKEAEAELRAELRKL